MDVIRKLWKLINSNISILLLIGMLGCIVGIILSYVFQNEKITALGYNMNDSDTQRMFLDEETILEYNMDFNEKLLGVQVRLSNYGHEIPSGTIRYRMSSLDDGHILGESEISAVGFVDGNYIFMSFAGFEKCIGRMKLTIWSDGVKGEPYPGFYVNTQEIPDVTTVVNGKVQDGNLMIIYNTPLYDKPLLFDFSMLLAVFFSVFILIDKKQITNSTIYNKLRKRESLYEEVGRE